MMAVAVVVAILLLLFERKTKKIKSSTSKYAHRQ